MDKKGISYMKIIIPVMAAIIIIGGTIVYSTKQPKAQEVMAPIETEQSVVTESEVSEPAPQPAKPDPASPAEPEATETVETVEDLEDGINSTHTDVELGDDEYQGDTGADALRSKYDSLSEEDQEMVDEIIAETKDEVMEKMKKEHPEWFTDNSSGNTNQGNYENVGTPDSGELPGKMELDGDYSQYQGAIVY